MIRIARSLHLRLALWLSLILVAVWAGLYINSRHAAVQAAAADTDARLKTAGLGMLQAAAVSGDTRHPDHRLSASANRVTADPFVSSPSVAAADAPRFEIVTADKQILARSPDFPDAARSARSGFDNLVADGRAWRVYTVTDRERGLTCRVAADRMQQEAREAALNRGFTHPLLWLLPLFAVGALATVWRGLAPLRAIEKAIDRQDPNNPQPLSIDSRHLPTELRGLVKVVDHLFTRLRDVLARQRAFTAAAGHELRTPLAGCKMQVQVARRIADIDDRNRAMAKVEQSIDRMGLLVNQLLLLARVEPAAPEIEKICIDMAALVQRVVAECAARAAAKEITLQCHADTEAARLLGDETLIEIMVANLIDNAIRFSPTGADIDIQAHSRDGHIVVAVRDYGPGIDKDECSRVFDHFYRSGRGGGSGSGLGLTIVMAIARAHTGNAELRPAQDGGTIASVQLPGLT